MGRPRSDSDRLEAAARFLKAFRAAAGWTQAKAAQEAGLVQSTISALEREEKAEDSTFDKIAAATGTTTEKIFSGEAFADLESRPPTRSVVLDVTRRDRLAAESANFEAFMRGRLLDARDGKDDLTTGEAEAALDHAARVLPPHHAADYDARSLKHAFAVGLAFVRGQEPPAPPPQEPAADRPMKLPRPLAASIAADKNAQPRSDPPTAIRGKNLSAGAHSDAGEHRDPSISEVRPGTKRRAPKKRAR